MDKLSVDRELFETLIDHAIELRSEWFWRANGSERMKMSYEELRQCIDEAVKVRDNITWGNKEV